MIKKKEARIKSRRKERNRTCWKKRKSYDKRERKGEIERERERDGSPWYIYTTHTIENDGYNQTI